MIIQWKKLTECESMCRYLVPNEFAVYIKYIVLSICINALCFSPKANCCPIYVLIRPGLACTTRPNHHRKCQEMRMRTR